MALQQQVRGIQNKGADFVVVDFENCLPLIAQTVSAAGQPTGELFDAGSLISVSCRNSRLVSFHNDYVRDAEEAKRQLSTLLKVPTTSLSAACFDISQNTQTQQPTVTATATGSNPRLETSINQHDNEAGTTTKLKHADQKVDRKQVIKRVKKFKRH